MTERAAADIDVGRDRVTKGQRAILDRVWEHYRDWDAWLPQAALHREFGKPAVKNACESLGEAVLRPCANDDGEACYRLTFLGVLLTTQGAEAEALLARYLEYVRDKCRKDPQVEWVGSREVEAALGLNPERSRLLRQLIRLSHWWGGGSGFGDREWTVGVPVDVDELPARADLREYVRGHVTRHFLPGAAEAAGASAAGPSPRNPFWFVRDGTVRQRLAADWHEAQEVFGVRGWKSCVILCGGILEAVVLDALSWGEPDPRHLPKQGAFRSSASLSRRPLSELIRVAEDRGLLVWGTVVLGPVLGDFSGLVHPGRKRKQVDPSHQDAEAALGAVRGCLRQLAARAERGTG
jgi:hypothetical protein